MTSALAARGTWKGPAHVRIREIGYYRNDRDQNPIGRLRSGSQLTSQTVLRATAQTLSPCRQRLQRRSNPSRCAPRRSATHPHQIRSPQNVTGGRWVPKSHSVDCQCDLWNCSLLWRGTSASENRPKDFFAFLQRRTVVRDAPFEHPPLTSNQFFVERTCFDAQIISSAQFPQVDFGRISGGCLADATDCRRGGKDAEAEDGGQVRDDPARRLD